MFDIFIAILTYIGFFALFVFVLNLLIFIPQLLFMLFEEWTGRDDWTGTDD